MRVCCLVLLAWLGALPVPALAQESSPSAQEEPLRAAVLPDIPPYVVKDGQGRLSGFTVELFRLIAAQMRRPITFETVTEPALDEGLARGTYNVLPGPIAATPDRAAEMLLTEGYVWSEFRFGSRTGEPVRTLADLRGRRVAIRAGSAYGEWAERNAQRYGFTVVPVANGVQGAASVVDHRADASLSASPVQDYAASRNANFSTGLSLPETRTHQSAAVRRADTELRDEVEDALRCLKTNGTVARLSTQWFGREPGAEDLENLVVPGYGVPGLAGYDPKPRKTRC